MEQTLSRLDGAIRPQQVGIDRDMFFDSVRYAKEVRDRFTILQLLWDLGLMEQFAGELTEYMFR
jgi:glycerol-1-phosphate dehydrogenase [NAD(P)+]